MTAELIIQTVEHVVGKPQKKWGGGPVMTGPEWKERGELYGHEAALVVCHDGGVLAPYFNYDYDCPKLIDKMNDALREIGYWGRALHHLVHCDLPQIEVAA